ncbi:methyltransferase [Pseudidiomarina aestuarii]|uniref:Methyltransferase n=1 Tax=Pseudidiomarina aestuarii TaxID=624146 RepID=A0A7Z6ZT69_9GAMM|nr:methyltransferase [Pseudidiomarina aestuarii]RUO40802.1 methyltransferase [Pseudidiomarina aestuarii]
MQTATAFILRQYVETLSAMQELWRLPAFAQRQWPWGDDESAFRQQSQQLLATLPDIVTSQPELAMPPAPFWLTAGIGGRKLEQIQAFVGQIQPSQTPLLEWCSGKGHLGRLLSFQQQRPVTSIEWNAQLCVAGQQAAQQHQLQQTFIHADALSNAGTAAIQAHPQVMALHACGQLHMRLLESAAFAKAEAIYVVPCCYPLIADEHYQPLSEILRGSDFPLTRRELKFVVQEQVTGGQRIENLRYTEVLWRLAYQIWRERHTGCSDYQPLRSVAKQYLTGTFSAFANWAAVQHGLNYDVSQAEQPLLEAALERKQLIDAIERVQSPFKRFLERLLILDRACFLEEQGYRVDIIEFCDYSITPRNYLLRAHQRHAESL